MKRTAATFVALLMFVVTGCMALRAQPQENAKPETSLPGFMGIKWGDSMEQAKKTLKAQGAAYQIANSTHWLTVNRFKIADYPVDHSLIQFGNDGFYNAFVFFPKSYKGTKLHSDLKGAFTKRFGPSSVVKRVRYGERSTAIATQWIFQAPSTGYKTRTMVQLSLAEDGEAMLEYRDIEGMKREVARRLAHWNKIK